MSFSEWDSRGAFVHPEIETEENVQGLYLAMAKILFQTHSINLQIIEAPFSTQLSILRNLITDSCGLIADS
jgi:hypothetical protein